MRLTKLLVKDEDGEYVECPDGGRCHHQCLEACFRVKHCVPLGVNEWPDDVKRVNAMLLHSYVL